MNKPVLWIVVNNEYVEQTNLAVTVEFSAFHGQNIPSFDEQTNAVGSAVELGENKRSDFY
jgi:hypothetical protein